jgi:hypothetical protein
MFKPTYIGNNGHELILYNDKDTLFFKYHFRDSRIMGREKKGFFPL